MLFKKLFQIKNFIKRILPKKLNSVVINTLLSALNIVLVAISSTIAYSNYANQREFNQLQIKQSEPLLDFTSFYQEGDENYNFTEIKKDMSRWCDTFYYSFENRGTNPAANLTFTITEVARDENGRLHSVNRDVAFENYVTVTKDEAISSYGNTDCFFLTDKEGNSNYQFAFLWWHVVTRYTDAITGKQFTRHFYGMSALNYNKITNGINTDSYTLTKGEFEKILNESKKSLL